MFVLLTQLVAALKKHQASLHVPGCLGLCWRHDYAFVYVAQPEWNIIVVISLYTTL